MAKVLTESEVAAIGGTSTSYGNRCCTKARAEELGCTVTEPSGAISNQLITGVEPATNTIWVSLELLVGTAKTIDTYIRQPEYNNIPIYAVGIVPFSSQASSCRLGFCNEPNMTINTSAIDAGSRLWCYGCDSQVGFEKWENGSNVYWSGWNNPPYRGFEMQDIKPYDGSTVSSVYVYENNNPSKISEYDQFSASPMYFYVYQTNAWLWKYYVQISRSDYDKYFTT